MCGSRPEPEEVTASAGTSEGFTLYVAVELSLTTAALAAVTQSIRSLLSPDRLVAPDRISEYCVLTLLLPRPLEGRGWNHFRSGRTASSASSGSFFGRLYVWPMSSEPTTLP